ncbi:MAG: hypothetical protein K2X03_26615 [Bryobacteraceae bacterium]|nr:hypothetical protein [Bryobacteraceae bacterium]
MNKQLADAIQLLQKVQAMPPGQSAEAVAALDQAMQMLISARREFQGPDVERGG